jgi:hypothetical protein
LKIPRQGKATFKATSENPKKVIRARKASKEITKAVVDIIQYINIRTLRRKYQVAWTDDTTMFLKIAFRDGTVKEIEDYGMIGTFGLNHLYELLSMLSKKSG